MKSKSAKPVTPLPEVEWDFYGLGDEEISLAFYYEFGRESETVKSEVEKMRAERKGHVWHYWPREHRLGKVICWLAQQESFPKTPWLALPGKGIERLVLMRGGNVNLRPAIGFKDIWGGDEQAVRAVLSERAQTFVPPSEDVIVPALEAGHFEFDVNWRLTDREILEAVADVLKQARPEQFKPYARTPTGQGGFDGEMLPFRMGAALQWLGVLRRRDKATTWREYFDCYCQGTEFGRGIERARDEDCRKAKLILAWFDNGAALKKEDFK